ncbi:hypothetical protein EON65_41855 [archaeon]|nr:MAG: hypothetical protein EON65_41855 [archaeon]
MSRASWCGRARQQPEHYCDWGCRMLTYVKKTSLWTPSATYVDHMASVYRVYVHTELPHNIHTNTHSQAYFLRMVHLTATPYLRIVIITNDWHMPRASAIFSHVLSLPEGGGGDAGGGRSMQR